MLAANACVPLPAERGQPRRRVVDNSVGPMSQRAGLVSQRGCLAAVPWFPHPSEAAEAPDLGCWWGWGFLSGAGGECRQRRQGAPLKWSPTSRSEAILVCIMNKGSRGGGETPKPELAGRQAGLLACPPCLPARSPSRL